LCFEALETSFVPQNDLPLHGAETFSKVDVYDLKNLNNEER